MKTKLLLPTLSLLTLYFFTFNAFGQTRPAIGGYTVYYGSLHNHSIVSDGTGTPDQAYAYARNVAKLDFFGLADHAGMITSSEWTEIKNAATLYNKEDVFAAFHGFEWTTFLSYGHVTVVNSTDVSSSSTFTQLVSWVNSRNCIAFFNHPGWDITAFQEFNHFTTTPSDKFVGMELWNDNDGFGKYYYNDGYFGNDGYKGYYDEALARKWRPGAAGADDNHDGDWGTATEYRVGVLANGLSRTSIFDAFNARRFFATEDKNLSLSFTMNGAEMGSILPGGIYEAKIMANDADNETFTEVQLYKNGVTYKTWINPGSSIITGVTEPNITCSSGDYFYVKVRQLGLHEAISSPIFISGVTNQAPAVSVTYPVNGQVISSGQTIEITASASDPDGSVTKVELYRNDILVTTDYTSPYSSIWTSATEGSYTLFAKAYDNAGASTQSATVSVTVTGQATSYTVERQIGSGTDDAEEYKTGEMDLGSTVLKLVYDTKATGNQTVGLMFRNLAIPQGSTITKAYIEFTPTATASASAKCSLTLRGEAANNANSANFESTTGNLSSRIKTTAGVSWSPGAWSKGVVRMTPEITSVVKEVVGRSGWTSSSNLVILITGTGTRAAASWENATYDQAKIHIEYTSAQAPAAAPASTKSASLETTSQSMPVDELLSPGEVLIYPNPVSDILTIRFTPEKEVEQIMIYSMTGSLVKAQKYNYNLPETQVDCSNLKPATYLLTIQTKQGRENIRFIKQ